MSLRKKLDEVAESAELFPALTNAEKEANRLLVEIAIQIQKRRKELHKTQRQLAYELSVSQPMVCQWESGDYNFTIEALSEIFDSLDMKIDLSFSPIAEAIIPQVSDYQIAEKRSQSQLQIQIYEAA